MENRKNTILLTVIAVATLLVAVVGATFAYFTAQGGTAANAPVKVQTYQTSTGSFVIDGEGLDINASQENFAKNGYSHLASTTATVTFKGATNDTGDASNEFCYRVALEVTGNTFTDQAATNQGILLVNASNTTGAFTAADALTNGSGTSATFATGTSGYTTESSSAGTPDTFSGFDVMPLTAGTYYFEKATGMENAGSVKFYKLTSTNGSTETDNWNFSVTLVNTEADQNVLTGKTFTSKIEFTQVSCTDGSEITND